MGYHVAIVRTGTTEGPIRQDEIVSVLEGKLGFTLERDEAGSIKQAFKEIAGEEVLCFYDGTELWTKNPTETVLKIMIEIAGILGRGARVRGDEGETYESVARTYTHPDDAHLPAKPGFYWTYWLPRALKGLVALFLVYSFGKLLLRYLSRTFGS